MDLLLKLHLKQVIPLLSFALAFPGFPSLGPAVLGQSFALLFTNQGQK
jgi:hypothetical protein